MVKGGAPQFGLGETKRADIVLEFETRGSGARGASALRRVRRVAGGLEPTRAMRV